MAFRRVLGKLRLFYKLYVAAPKDWRPPRLCEVLIYDDNTTAHLEPYLKDRSVSVLLTGGELINVTALLHAITQRAFWKGKFYLAYIVAFVKASKPKLVVTIVDNISNFYQISKSCGVTTAFIQNGIRGSKYGDVFFELPRTRDRDCHVDHMLVFGSAIGKKYQSYISGEITVIGSFKNNLVSKSKLKTTPSVLFISQYRKEPKNNAPLHYEEEGLVPISHDSFFSSERILLNFLANWCVNNNKTLKIAACGRHCDKDCSEADFYESICGLSSYSFIPHLEPYDTYKLIDATEIVVTIDSTMGLEAIARGKKTAFFNTRGMETKNTTFLRVGDEFGWPAELPDHGPFWTNHRDEKEVKRIMDYLCKVSDQEFEETWQQYKLELMDYDSGNTRFVALLDRLLS